MILSRRAREILLVAGLIALPALLLRASTKSPQSLNIVDRTLLRLTAPLQGALVSAFFSLSDLWTRYVALVGVKQENERLRMENIQLKSRLEMLSQAKDRGDRLERLLELREQAPSQTLAARIVGVETSPQFRVVRVRIDRGGGDVRPGMPVLSASGVIGRIAHVVGPYSDVLLAVDPRSSIDVVIPRVGSRGVLKGIPGENRYRCRIDYLLRQDQVQVGDEVVTSGLGGIFPRDVPVGKVTKITRQAFGLYQDVEVEPAADLGKLREVLVVLSPPPPADPDAGKRPVESARGLTVPR